MKTDRNTKLLAFGPQRIVRRIVPRAFVDLARQQEDRLEAVFLYTAPGLRGRGLDVMRRYHRGAVHALAVGRHEIVEPIVVGARDRGGNGGIDTGRARG